MGKLLHAYFGVTHGRRTVAVERTEVALAIDQRVTHVKGLRHPDDGVIGGGITVRVVFTDHITNDTGRLHISPVIDVVQLAHGEQHAAVHRFEAVANVWQGAADDDTHGIVQVGLLELIFDVDCGYFVFRF